MWGGRKIETVLGKTLPPGPIGESWELFDFPPGAVDDSRDWISSEVAEGPLAGMTLHELVGRLGSDLLGMAPLTGPHGQFPILIKFLDAGQDLSVQVHPDAQYARVHPGAHLKSEAWYVVQADSGSRLLKGLRPGVTRQSFAKAIADGTVESSINSIAVKRGDCFYLPSGTVHALGAGILAAEVQTPSDTTFRVFDFNRVDPSTGKLRTLHVEQAMQCIDFSEPKAPIALAVPQLVKCDYFCIEKAALSKGKTLSIKWGEPTILMLIAGRGRVSSTANDISTRFEKGDTILLPSALKEPKVTAESSSEWLQITLGVEEDVVPAQGSRPR